MAVPCTGPADTASSWMTTYRNRRVPLGGLPAFDETLTRLAAEDTEAARIVEFRSSANLSVEKEACRTGIVASWCTRSRQRPPSRRSSQQKVRR
jgi:hypothetical protein